MTDPVLEIDHLDVRYGEVVALAEVQLRIEPARVCGLVGVNGAGKSTLLQVLAGLIRPDRGRIRIAGRPPEQARRDGRIAYVPQHERVDWSFPISIREIVAAGRYGRQGPLRRPSPADRKAVDDAIEKVGLAELAERPVGQLSGGQRKRAFVARGIAQDADLLLLDEPFAGVDRASETGITRLLRALATDGRTVVVASHDLHALPTLCDEVALLRRRVLAHGPTAQMLVPQQLAPALGLDPDGEVDRWT